MKAYADRYRGSLPPELEGEVAEGGRVIFQVQPQQVETSLEDAYGLLRDASKVLRGDTPSPASDCEYCRWQAMGTPVDTSP